jgi:hypothetical protein
MQNPQKDVEQALEAMPAKKLWRPLKLTLLGRINEIVQGGGGKSGGAADPGDPAKPPGQA